ncbi:MAG: class I SAM-dependent methyltransferase [Mycobacteriales bacterium]
MAERVPSGPVWRALTGELDRSGGPGHRPAVLDVGGGTGVLAVPLATAGATVTVIDASADAIATLQRRAVSAGVVEHVTGQQGDLDAIPTALDGARYDLVVCHSVLEYVDDPVLAARELASVLGPGGALSVLVANRAAIVLARALGGHFAAARHAAADPHGRYAGSDPARQRFDLTEVTVLLKDAGLLIESARGVHVFTDLVPGAAVDGVPGAAEELQRLEDEVGETPPYRDFAAQLHVLARRP